MKPKLYILAGANGSGKSTISKVLLPAEGIVYINPDDIANMVLYLCSDMAGFITGENICIDGGQTKLMIYHGDHGWTLE